LKILRTRVENRAADFPRFGQKQYPRITALPGLDAIGGLAGSAAWVFGQKDHP